MLGTDFVHFPLFSANLELLLLTNNLPLNYNFQFAHHAIIFLYPWFSYLAAYAADSRAIHAAYFTEKNGGNGRTTEYSQ